MMAQILDFVRRGVRCNTRCQCDAEALKEEFERAFISTGRPAVMLFARFTWQVSERKAARAFT